MARRNSNTHLTPVVNDPHLLAKLVAAGAKLIKLDGKQPIQADWQNSRKVFVAEPTPDCNYGLVHWASYTLSLDIDDVELATKALSAKGVDLEALLNKGWRIFSPKKNRAKAIYKMPPDVEKRGRTFSGRLRSEDGSPDRAVAFIEMRSGRLQDFVWGVHPEGGSLGHAPFNGFPECPPELIDLLKLYDTPDGREHMARLAGLEPIRRGDANPGHLPFKSEWRRDFNNKNDVEAMLEAAGYVRKGKKRWITAHSSTGLPGIIQVPETDDLWYCHHAGDPLEGCFDAWTIYVSYLHDGDVRAANVEWYSGVLAERKKAKEKKDKIHEDKKAREGIGTSFTLQELIHTKIAPLKWIVRDLLPPGLCILSSDPKAGKSYLIMQLALCVAAGKPFLTLPTSPSKVVYYDLESSSRIIQDRSLPIMKAHGIEPEATANLLFELTCPSGEDAIADIRAQLEANPGIRLIIVDVLARVRDELEAGKGVYQGEYQQLVAFKEICTEYPDLALVFIHHTNKGKHEDPFHAISGSNAMAGATDTNWIMQRLSHQGIGIDEEQDTVEAVKKHVKLHVQGKELPHATELMLKHMEDRGGWEVTDVTESQVKATGKRRKILQLMGTEPEKVWTSEEIHTILEFDKVNTTRNTLKQMKNAGLIESVGRGPSGGYKLPKERK